MTWLPRPQGEGGLEERGLGEGELGEGRPRGLRRGGRWAGARSEAGGSY